MPAIFPLLEKRQSAVAVRKLAPTRIAPEDRQAPWTAPALWRPGDRIREWKAERQVVKSFMPAAVFSLKPTGLQAGDFPRGKNGKLFLTAYRDVRIGRTPCLFCHDMKTVENGFLAVAAGCPTGLKAGVNESTPAGCHGTAHSVCLTLSDWL